MKIPADVGPGLATSPPCDLASEASTKAHKSTNCVVTCCKDRENKMKGSVPSGGADLPSSTEGTIPDILAHLSERFGNVWFKKRKRKEGHKSNHKLLLIHAGTNLDNNFTFRLNLENSQPVTWFDCQDV